jgi:20S proteasome alpha/beta subunit
LRYDIRYDLMSLQDAVDFAVFIVRATIEAQRFNQGSLMGVGGAIDVAVVTPDGFRWLQKKGISVEGRPVER